MEARVPTRGTLACRLVSKTSKSKMSSHSFDAVPIVLSLVWSSASWVLINFYLGLLPSQALVSELWAVLKLVGTGAGAQQSQERGCVCGWEKERQRNRHILFSAWCCWNCIYELHNGLSIGFICLSGKTSPFQTLKKLNHLWIQLTEIFRRAWTTPVMEVFTECISRSSTWPEGIDARQPGPDQQHHPESHK